jgi:branched-chain amino acid transport system substrate-binding protein
MVNRRTTVLSLTSIAAGMSATLAGCGAKVPDTLKIGVVVAQSGPFGTRGKDLLRGAELAAEELNASGYKIAGKPVKVEVVNFDDKGEIDDAAEGARQLLSQGVHAIIGPQNTPQVAKAIPVIAEAGVPHLYTGTSPGLNKLGRGNTFRLLATDDLQSKAAASFVAETLHGQRVAIIYEDTDYGRGLNEGVTAALAKLKVKPLSAAALDTKADVTAAMAAKLKADNVDVVMLMSREPHLKSLFKVLKEAAYTNVTVLGANPIRTRTVAALDSPVKALYATATALDAAEFLNGKAFLTAFEARFKEPPVWGAHYAYDAVFAVAGAAALSESVEAPTLIKTLKTKELRTRVNHQMRFDDDGEQRYASISVYQAERGAWQLQVRSSQW